MRLSILNEPLHGLHLKTNGMRRGGARKRHSASLTMLACVGMSLALASGVSMSITEFPLLNPWFTTSHGKISAKLCGSGRPSDFLHSPLPRFTHPARMPRCSLQNSKDVSRISSPRDLEEERTHSRRCGIPSTPRASPRNLYLYKLPFCFPCSWNNVRCAGCASFACA